MTWQDILKYRDFTNEFINLIEQEGYSQVGETSTYEKDKSQIGVGELDYGITAAYLEDDEERPAIKHLTLDGIKVLLVPKFNNTHLRYDDRFRNIVPLTQKKLQEEIKAQDRKAILSIWNKMKAKGKPTKHKGLIDFGGYKDLVYGTDEYSEYGPNIDLR